MGPKKWGDHPCSHYHPKVRERKASDINSAPLPLILPAPLNSLPSPFALPPSLSKGGLAQSLSPKHQPLSPKSGVITLAAITILRQKKEKQVISTPPPSL